MIEVMVEDVCQVKPFLDEQEARAWLGNRTARDASRRRGLFAGHPSRVAAMMGGLRRNPNACM
jgi:hypothetical protein